MQLVWVTASIASSTTARCKVELQRVWKVGAKFWRNQIPNAPDLNKISMQNEQRRCMTTTTTQILCSATEILCCNLDLQLLNNRDLVGRDLRELQFSTPELSLQFESTTQQLQTLELRHPCLIPRGRTYGVDGSQLQELMHQLRNRDPVGVWRKLRFTFHGTRSLILILRQQQNSIFKSLMRNRLCWWVATTDRKISSSTTSILCSAAQNLCCASENPSWKIGEISDDQFFKLVLQFWIYVDSATSNFWARSSVLQFQDAELTESMVNTFRNSITQLRRFVPTENGGIGVACLVQFVVHFWICFIFKLDLQNWSKLPNSPNLGSWTCRTSNLHNSDLPLLIVDRCRCCGTTTATRASPAATNPPFYRLFLHLQHRIGCWSWRNNNFRRLHDGRGGRTRVVHPTDLPLVPKHVVLQLNNHDSVGAWRNRSCLIVPTRGPFWTFWISKLDLQNWLKVHGPPIWSS